MGVSDVLGHVGCQDLSEDEAGFKVAKDAWFYLDLQSRRGLKNGGPCLKTKPWFILGVRLQEGMSRSQGWHLVVKIFQLALPNSHEHPNAIGISNDNGPPEFDMLLYSTRFYMSFKTPQEFPVECWRCGFQTSSCALPLSQCLGLNRPMPGGSNGWFFVIPKQQKTSATPTAPTSNLILYRWNSLLNPFWVKFLFHCPLKLAILLSYSQGLSNK